MHKGTYHKDKLSANRLLKCYELAPPRIRHCLDAEIQFVISNTHGADLVLELGCGYERFSKAGSPSVSMIAGNDISIDLLLHLSRTIQLLFSGFSLSFLIRSSYSRILFRAS
jgi:hypothetical protein